MSISVKVLYFGQARDGSGIGEETFTFSEGVSLRSLVRESNKRHPSLARMKGSMQFALNEEIADGDPMLDDGDVVAFLPPVAGG